MTQRLSWTCPRCARTVPTRVPVCRCGGAQSDSAQPPPGSPADQLPAATPQSDSVAGHRTAAIAAAVLVVLALGGVTAWSWTRATAAAQPAPVEAVDTGPTVAELHALLTTTPAVEKTVPAPVRVVVDSTRKPLPSIEEVSLDRCRPL